MEKCKVNGHWISTDMSVRDLIAHFGIDVKISFSNDESDFYRDFCLDGSWTETMLIAIKCTSKTNKIEAIKVTRYCTNWGLKEAKDFVEYLML